MLVLLFLVYATLLIGNDAERMLVYAYPVLIPIAMLSLLDFSKKTGIRLRYCATVCILIQILCLISNFGLVDGLSKHITAIVLFICIVPWLWAEWRLSRASKLQSTTSALSVLTDQ
jgi:hypothetical protein